MRKTLLCLLLAFGSQLPAPAQPAPKSATALPPAWAQKVVWYQIFVERFANGDPSNDPKPENMRGSFTVPAGWSITPWTHNWYQPEPWATAAKLNFNDTRSLRRFGGDLQGVLDKLDYLRELGVTALYLNPINDAPSLHKYDARSYHHVDVTFGPDPVGDNKLIASENPNDPASWKWTSADRLFLKLVAEAHKRNMRVVLDYSWNHTGVEFWAWQDIVRKQQQSAFKDWYDITRFDDPKTAANEFDYNGWVGLKSLPEIKKVDITTPRKAGKPYEGELNSGAQAHIFAVTKRWLAPDGNAAQGIDGYRLDVADQVPMGFWRKYRTFVKSVKPEAYLVGEIWWETWPDKLMNPVPYTSGDVFDGVMFYQAYRPARSFFAAVKAPLTGPQLIDSLQFQWNRLGKPFRYAMMNVASTHDAPRLLTCFYNPGQYKYKATPGDDPNYKTGKPDPETYQRVKLYLLHQFTSIGAPQIWNGDELGMWGADDPDCRKPLWWPGLTFEPETRTNFQPTTTSTFDPVGYNAAHYAYYRQLAHLRNGNPVLQTGELTFLPTKGQTLAYQRTAVQERIVVLFNLEGSPQQFTLPEKGSWLNLLTGKTVVASTATLPTLSGMALKKVK
ncbi:glycoside hydrolase family 13 protein [Hymenobacter lucidus]|uniref:Glycoside hydrolase family 13 protein n=1 Tax=Hymenobacter lucidus TaxID=2880930 RepID=A0ABS8ASQ3_9BACT|nr:glycoside hydrolase family 13 protein [Hymenobacter lucidus]MCB2407736.1 glycoside hydrolase family 13 protein [Hymenobacter lucidus]